MRILVDENIPRKTVAWLRERGHDVLDLRGTEALERIPEVEWPNLLVTMRDKLHGLWRPRS